MIPLNMTRAMQNLPEYGIIPLHYKDLECKSCSDNTSNSSNHAQRECFRIDSAGWKAVRAWQSGFILPSLFADIYTTQS